MRVHSTPTSASWMNKVERFVAALTERQIRHGTYHSTLELNSKGFSRPTTAIRDRSYGSKPD